MQNIENYIIVLIKLYYELSRNWVKGNKGRVNSKCIKLKLFKLINKSKNLYNNETIDLPIEGLNSVHYSVN